MEKMKHKKHIINNPFIISGLAILLAISCAQERPEQCSQGQCLSDLMPITVDKTSYSLETTEPLPGKQSSAATKADKFIPDENYSEINDLPHVEFNSDPFVMHFLNGVPFRGRPNWTYQIVFKLTKDHLTVYKVGAKKDIPSQEWSYGELLNDGRMEVPIVSYNISLKRMENIDDARGEPTEVKREFPAYAKGEATHFKVDMVNRTEFAGVPKQDVFKKDFLDGEWFYLATVVFNESNRPTGYPVALDFNYRYLNRVVFHPETNKIIGYNVNIDKDVDKSDQQNLSEAITIPAKWCDFKVQKITKSDVTKEKCLEGTGIPQDESKDWEERSFMQLDFAKMKTGFTERNRIQLEGNVRFRKLEISSNYIGIVVEYIQEKIQVRYSFLKFHGRKINPRLYNLTDQLDAFGLLHSYKSFIYDNRYYRRDSIQEIFPLNRFYPEPDESGQKTIYYHLTSRSSPLFDDVASWAIDEWNKAHKKAGTGINVKFIPREEKTVSLGDIRYNAINILDLESKDNPYYGMAPRIADAQTGEIISGVANVYVKPMKNRLFSMIRSYIRAQMGVYNSRYLGNLSSVFMNESWNLDNISLWGEAVKTPFAHNQNDIHQTMLWNEDNNDFHDHNIIDNLYDQNIIDYSSKDLLNLGKNERNPIQELLDQRESISFNPDTKNSLDASISGGSCDYQYGVVYENFSKMIEKRCPAVVEFVERYNSEYQNLKPLDRIHQISSLEETVVVDSCLGSIIKDSVKYTLIHELGHDFNLDHNPAASSDLDNFHNGKEGERNRKSGTSSVMDYISLSNEDSETLQLGKYDIAALRYGYTGQIEVKKEGDSEYSLAKVPNGQSVRDFVKEQKLTRKPYKFCHQKFIGLYDPLCQFWDWGVSPLEIVDFYINQINVLYATRGHKLDKAYGPIPRSFNRVVFFYMARMRAFYDQWRYHLKEYISHVKGYDSPYLHTFNEESFNKLLDDMSVDPLYSEKYKQYRPAAEKVYHFYKRLIKTPTRHCLITYKHKTNGQELIGKIIELASISDQIGATSQSRYITSCNDSDLQDYLVRQSPMPAHMNKSLYDTIITPLGEHLQDINKNNDIANEYYNAYFNTLNAEFYNNKEDCLKMLNSYRLHYRLGWSAGSCVKRPSRVDIVGKEGLRMMALDLMTSRFFYPEKRTAPFERKRYRQVGLAHIKSDFFFPNMLDEPSYSKEMIDYLKGRIIDGVSLTDFNEDIYSKENINTDKIKLPVFNRQENFSYNLYLRIYYGHLVPGEFNLSFKRMNLFQFHRFTNSSFIPENYIRVTMEKNDGQIYVAAPNEPDLLAYSFIEKYNSLKNSLDLHDSFSRRDWRQLNTYLQQKENQILNRDQDSNCNTAKPNLLNMRLYLSCLPLLKMEDLKTASKKDFYEKVNRLKQALESVEEDLVKKIYSMLFESTFLYIKYVEELWTGEDESFLDVFYTKFLEQERASSPVGMLTEEFTINILFLLESSSLQKIDDFEFNLANLARTDITEKHDQYKSQLSILTNILLGEF